MKSKIVVTGGAGFIGSHLAERLCASSKLVLFDNLRRNSLEWAPALKTSENVELVQGNVLDTESLLGAVAGADAVFHLAAIAGVSSYYNQPLDTLKVNLLGTVNVLEACVKAGVKRLIYCSTSEVFGTSALWVSDDSPYEIGPASEKRWVYATSKMAGEQFVKRYQEAHGISATVVRPFNIYGPRQTGEGAISNFCVAAVEGKPLVVYGDGSALRAWCYVSDFVDALIKILETPDAGGKTFNIGNPSEVVNTLGLAREVARQVPGTKIEFKEIDRAEVQARIPMIENAKRHLSFKPSVGLEEGIRRTLEWFRSREKK